jgi:hypothetical protein
MGRWKGLSSSKNHLGELRYTKRVLSGPYKRRDSGTIGRKARC